MMKTIRDENGSIMLFTLALLGVMTLLFSVLLNLTKVYAVKQQAATAAQQASLAATSEIYQAVDQAIQKTDAEAGADLICSDDLDAWSESLAEQINKKKSDISSEWVGAEIEREATSSVLEEKLLDPNYICLKENVEEELFHSTNKIRDAANTTAVLDGGNMSDTEIKIINDHMNKHRVEVKTTSTFHSQKFDAYIPEDRRRIDQTGAGPAIGFLKHVNWTLN